MFNTIKYIWPDAWLLASIAIASKNKNDSAELWQIFSAGDRLNHAIFTPEEIISGLVRLRSGNWIKEEGNTKRFSVTNKFKKMDLKINNYDSVIKLTKILNATCWDKNEPIPHPENVLKYPGLDENLLFEQLEKYKKMHRFE